MAADSTQLISLAPHFKEIENRVSSAQFIEEIWLQLQRDAQSCGLDFSGLKPNHVSDLIEGVKMFLSQLNPSQLHNLLYRVDVPENVLEKWVLSEETLDEWVTIILKREALKVYFRYRFSH